MGQDMIQLLIGGLLLGGIYSLAAIGLSISFGVLNVLNLAHGEFLVLGALAGFLAFVHLGMNPFLSAVLVMPLFFVIGAAYYLVFLKPIGSKPPDQQLVASMLITLGSALIIEDLVTVFWERPVTGIPYALPALYVGGVFISSLRMLILLFIGLLAVALQVCLKRTLLGMCIRAVTQCREGAEISGVPIPTISAAAFGLGAALAASAGVFYVVLFTVSPATGIPLTIKYLCIVVLGGLGSMIGVVVGSVILGLAESFSANFIGAQWSPCIGTFLLLVMLIIRPQGLFGKKS